MQAINQTRQYLRTEYWRRIKQWEWHEWSGETLWLTASGMWDDCIGNKTRNSFKTIDCPSDYLAECVTMVIATVYEDGWRKKSTRSHVRGDMQVVLCCLSRLAAEWKLMLFTHQHSAACKWGTQCWYVATCCMLVAKHMDCQCQPLRRVITLSRRGELGEIKSWNKGRIGSVDEKESIRKETQTDVSEAQLLQKRRVKMNMGARGRKRYDSEVTTCSELMFRRSKLKNVSVQCITYTL